MAMDDRITDQYIRQTGESWEAAVRRAHARFGKTRCAAWLAATGNRPTKPENVSDSGGAKGARLVWRAAEPNPAHSCDIHPVET